MPVLLIRQTVADYPAWKSAFDDERASRWANGCRGAQVYRDIDAPGGLLIVLEWDDPVRARLYSQSDDLWYLIARTGVTGRPDVWLAELADDVAR